MSISFKDSVKERLYHLYNTYLIIGVNLLWDKQKLILTQTKIRPYIVSRCNMFFVGENTFT